jgi:hypothetical protein
MDRGLIAVAFIVKLVLNGCGFVGRDMPPVIGAARDGDAVRLRQLLAAGADPNQPAGVNSWPPIMHAIHKNQKESVRVLLKHGADPNYRAPLNATPLMMAAGYGYADIVAVLLDAGADPMVRDAHGATALTMAVGGTSDIDRFTVGRCQSETVRVLLARAPQLRGTAGAGAVRVAKLAGCSDIVKMVE